MYVQRFPELGRKVQVSQGGGIDPVWSPDGTRLYRASPGLRTYDIGKGTPLLAIKPDEAGRNPEIHVVLNWTEELKRLVPTR